MSAVCAACGVGVVPGMVRCPKCGAGLPRSKRGATQVQGGTALPSAGGFPVAPVAIGAAAVIAVIAFIALRGDKATQPTIDDASPEEATEVDTASAPQPETAAEVPKAPTPSADVDPGPALRMIEAGLRREKLWGTVSTAGDRVDVRSGGCGEPAMAPLIDSASAGLHQAGMTTLRCLDPGGAVVFERGL